MPWCGTMSFDTAGRTMMGVTSAGMVDDGRKAPNPPLAFGANCGVGASDLLRTVLGFAAQGTERPIIAKGNAGHPEICRRAHPLRRHARPDGRLRRAGARCRRPHHRRLLRHHARTPRQDARRARDAPAGRAPDARGDRGPARRFSSASDGTGDDATPARRAERGRRRRRRA
jgi:5-methyltetrahydrofolate--homocysteine methyltransferase